MSLEHKQIGEVSERTGLSLRTIRYYEEQGLVTPSARTHGGFRLYTEADVARLFLVRRMKPLDFTLEEVRDILAVLDTLDQSDLETSERDALIDRLTAYETIAQERCSNLRDQLSAATEFATSLQRELRRQRLGVSVNR